MTETDEIIEAYERKEKQRKKQQTPWRFPTLSEWRAKNRGLFERYYEMQTTLDEDFEAYEKLMKSGKADKLNREKARRGIRNETIESS